MTPLLITDRAALGPLKATWKSGQEPFRNVGTPASFTLLEFWRWSASDLVNNTTRGVLAEFIVARALGVPTSCSREAWDSYDLLTPGGTRVEVKSAAYIQSWGQPKLSAIQFVVPQRRGFDRNTGAMEAAASRHADVYVFALLAHQVKATIDPLDLDQWRFWVVATRVLNERTRSQHSITLHSLEKLAGPSVAFNDLADAVTRVAG